MVYVRGRTVYLGQHNSPESRRKYAEILGQLQSRESVPADQVSVAELVLAYNDKEIPRFSSSERHCQRTALRLLVEHFGEIPAKEFGPRRLRELRDKMIAGAPPRKPWSRKTTNRQVKRVLSLFKWGASDQLISEQVHRELCTLRPLRKGEGGAAESLPRVAVSQSDINAALAKLKPVYRDLLKLIHLTAARPSEILGLTTGALDRSDDEWVTEVKSHKNLHRDKARHLVFNQAAQKILVGYLKADPDERLFPIRRDVLATALKRACVKAEIEPFCAHRLSGWPIQQHHRHRGWFASPISA